MLPMKMPITATCEMFNCEQPIWPLSSHACVRSSCRAVVVTFLVERLAELKKHLDHLAELAPRVTGAEALRQDLSLHNDVLFSLLTVAQRFKGFRNILIHEYVSLDYDLVVEAVGDLAPLEDFTRRVAALNQ